MPSLLHLSRSEGALFGLALLPLLGRVSSRRAGAVGTAVALAIGLGWFVRGALLTYPEDIVARATLLVRYEDFFAIEPPTLSAFLDATLFVIFAKIGALVTNAVTALMALLLVLVVPLIVAMRRRSADPAVAAFVGLGLVIFLAQSLLFTQHSTRGSFFHSVAAFFPFAVALAAAGAQDLFGSPARGLARALALVTVAAYVAISAVAVIEWDAAFNVPYRQRVAAAALLPPGPLVVTDAAAWRWITGRETVVAPSDHERAGACAAEIYLAETLILEPAHFTAYNTLYDTGASEWFTLRDELNGIRMYEPDPDTRCIVPIQL